MKMRGTRASLGPNMSFEGKMEVDGELRVDGRLKGDLVCRRLVVSSEGLFEGRAEVSDVLIEGGVSGEIVAHGLVTIRRGARVMADILYSTLAMEEGSFFNGRMGLVESRSAAP
jgi:cytoskeletal protein CcmA (bactofilin family)